MSIDRIVMAFAGTVILVSVLLSIYHNVNWLWLTGFVGFNLLQSAFTGFFPIACRPDQSRGAANRSWSS